MFRAPILVSPFTFKATLGGIGAKGMWAPVRGHSWPLSDKSQKNDFFPPENRENRIM